MSNDQIDELDEIEDVAADSPEEQEKSGFMSKKIGNVIPVWIVLLIVGILLLGGSCGICSLSGYSIYNRVTGEPELEPTPFSSTEFVNPAQDSAIIILSETDTITMSLDIPTSVKLEGQTFVIHPQIVEDGGEFAPSEGDDTAVWLYGTIVNYVLLFNDSDSTRPLMEQIAPGDAIMLRTQSGKEIPFTFASRETVTASNADVYSQTSPGVTLILAGSNGDDRLVVTGHYDLDTVSQSAEQSIAELGEPVQLEDLQITATGAVYQLADASTGFANYLVDYQVQNMSLTAVDTSQLNYLLIDDFGNRYAYNAAVSQLGNNPPLSGYLNANENRTATAGFQIPIGLSSERLRFVVTQGAAQVLISIPFQSSSSADGASITLLAATVSPDLTTLALTGQVTNLGDQALLITESDVSLTTNDGTVYWLLSTNPPFPWTIGPGQTVPYSVSFQLPTTEPATFTILNQPFQLTALH